MTTNNTLRNWAHRNQHRYQDPTRLAYAITTHALHKNVHLTPHTLRATLPSRERAVPHGVLAHTIRTAQQHYYQTTRGGEDREEGAGGGTISQRRVAWSNQIVVSVIGGWCGHRSSSSSGSLPSVSVSRLGWAKRLGAHVCATYTQDGFQDVILSQRYAAAVLGCSVPKARQAIDDALALGFIRPGTVMRDGRTRTYRPAPAPRLCGACTGATAAGLLMTLEPVLSVLAGDNGGGLDEAEQRLVDLLRHADHPAWEALPATAWAWLVREALVVVLAGGRVAAHRHVARLRRQDKRGGGGVPDGLAVAEEAWAGWQVVHGWLTPNRWRAGSAAVMSDALAGAPHTGGVVGWLDDVAAEHGLVVARAERLDVLAREANERRQAAYEAKEDKHGGHARLMRTSSERADGIWSRLTSVHGVPPVGDAAVAVAWLGLAREALQAGGVVGGLDDRARVRLEALATDALTPALGEDKAGIAAARLLG